MCKINAPKITAEEYSELCKDAAELKEVFVILECNLRCEEFLAVTDSFEKAVEICRERFAPRAQSDLEYEWRSNSQSLKFIGDWMVYFILKEKIR